MRSIVLAVVTGLLASAAVAQDWGKVATVSATMGVGANQLCLGEGSRGDIGCPAYAPSVTTAGNMIVSGSVTAASFIGDGSGLFNIAGASADRIVSGTTKMLAVSNTGYISITQAGTNTGWFDPTLGLVTIGVSSTGRISATSGYFGNLGVGTSNVFDPLTVIGGSYFQGNISLNGSLTLNPGSAGGPSIWYSNSSNTGYYEPSPANLSFATTGVERMRVNNTGVSIGTQTSATTALEVSGTVSATRFVGDGSGLFNIAGASADRIVSGSTSILAISNTGYISITQAGTNTGWFDPTRGLVTIGVSSTGPISATSLFVSGAGYFGSNLTTNGINNGYSIMYGEQYSAPGYQDRLYMTAGSHIMTFTTSNTEAMRIVSTGFVGIGTPSPTTALQVSGAGVFSGYLQAGNGAFIKGGTGGFSSQNGVLTIQATDGYNYPNEGGSLLFNYAAGGNNVSGAGIRAQKENAVFGDWASDLLFGVVGHGGSVVVEAMRIVSTGDVGIGTISPTNALEVSGTISATRFVGNGSGLTGVVAGNSDRIVSGSVSMVAEQTSGTVRVSGTLAMVNTGNEVCNAATWYSFRVNPSTGQMQMCRP